MSSASQAPHGDLGPVLTVRDLEVTFPTARGPLRAVGGISYAIDPGRTLGVVGEAGGGAVDRVDLGHGNGETEPVREPPEARRVVDQKERLQAERCAIKPGQQGDIAADSGRLPHGEGDRPDHQRNSTTASRRRSLR